MSYRQIYFGSVSLRHWLGKQGVIVVNREGDGRFYKKISINIWDDILNTKQKIGLMGSMEPIDILTLHNESYLHKLINSLINADEE
jgi:hypothetical protein